MQRNGQRLRYKNVTTLDLTDDSNWDVDNTVWRSEEMAETDLFKPQIPLLPTNGAPFAAYLFLWFFPNVTSVNLSRTKWSDSAACSINFAEIIQLIWRYSYITTNSFLSPLFACTNLIELQLDNSTFRLPYTERGQPWYWMDIGEDGHFPYNIFDNLDHCKQLKNSHVQIVGCNGTVEEITFLSIFFVEEITFLSIFLSRIWSQVIFVPNGSSEGRHSHCCILMVLYTNMIWNVCSRDTRLPTHTTIVLYFNWLPIPWMTITTTTLTIFETSEYV